ncbi:hypothetical protein BT96DRAFT_914355 [Gymnopus androsaceus JB14]|uniref:Uncharacterized protein n=1 Tax=Gymnopus androsaceus JB14 TaxID=1447944 RepID=A0A6A4IFH4_9AGAR|nr:hypothetical protein BT96DRAFT_914355 [Gymnopus androsaceus JB14]
MTISFSLTDPSVTTYSTYTQRHDFPTHTLSDDLAQESNAEATLPNDSNSSQSDNTHFHANLLPDSNDDKDFLRGRRVVWISFRGRACAQDRPNQVQPKAQFQSHKRTPSATLRWTREILKKIRLSSSSSNSALSDSVVCSSNALTVESPPDDFQNPPSQPVSDPSFEEKCTTDVTSMSKSFGGLHPSVSSSSSLSTSSSNGLGNISISLSSSSEFDDSCDDTDEDSDSELDSLKEIDLGDGLTEEDDKDDVEHVEYVGAVRGTQVYPTTTITVVPPSPPLSTCSTSSFSACSDVESAPESFRAIDDDPEETPLEYALEPRASYTCLPSPLSHINPDPELSHTKSMLEPSLLTMQPQRHLYVHRGHSRNAFHYRKWFWAVREEDWARYAEWVEQREAYAGMSLSPEITDSQDSDGNAAIGEGEGELKAGKSKTSDHDLFKLFPSLFSSARETMPNNLQQWVSRSGCNGLWDVSLPSSIPPLSIHPRWGDLVNFNLSTSYSSVASCTDTWCMHTDRYLLVGMGLGLWTIRKVLWISELNRMFAADRTRCEEGEQTYVAEESLVDSRQFEDDDEEEGQVMLLCSSTPWKAISESEVHVASTSSMSVLAAQADAQRSGRSVDFEKTCSSSYGPLDDDEDDSEGEFEEINLGLGCDPCSPTATKRLSLALNTLHSNSATSVKGKSGRLSRQEEPPILAKRSWYEQCELLLTLSGARESTH